VICRNSSRGSNPAIRLCATGWSCRVPPNNRELS
jgi:hypothetical protein